MTKSITFAELENALRKLGFEKKAVPDAPVGYEHLASDTVLLFRSHRSDEMVPPGSLAATRKLLIDRGLVDPERWDEMLQVAAA
jgi:hypothetical protein